MLTIERVMVLHSAEIFADVPDDVLAVLADGLDIITVGAGDQVIVEGELGTSLYIIIDGEVRVHIGGRDVGVLGERAAFGELAALDPEPRLASITATTATRLFRVDNSLLLELIGERVELARAVIRFLCGRVRKTSTTLSEPVGSMNSGVAAGAPGERGPGS